MLLLLHMIHSSYRSGSSSLVIITTITIYTRVIPLPLLYKLHDVESVAGNLHRFCSDKSSYAILLVHSIVSCYSCVATRTCIRKLPEPL